MIPTPWTFVLLALASYRLTRLVGWDVITRPPRTAIIRRLEEGSAKQARDRTKGRRLPGYRPHLDDFVHCPFCQGWWTGLAVWGAWLLWPRFITIAAVPWALNAVVGLVTKTLDD